MESGLITVNILRFNPESGKSYYQKYLLPAQEKRSVQEVIRLIYHELDATLAFRDYNCFQGVCACCMVKLNGKAIRSCSTFVNVGDEITIEAVNFGRIVKDLVTTLDS